MGTQTLPEGNEPKIVPPARGPFRGPGVYPLIDAVASVFAQAYQLARIRVLESGSQVMQSLSRRDHLLHEIELLRREIAVLRTQRASVSPHKRPEYPPEQRFAILQLMRLRDWTAKRAAKHFVMHANTVRAWRQAIEGKRDPTALLGQPRWNTLDDAVKHAIHELRRLCPQSEFGTRTIARHLVRSAIKVSRSCVQQQLRKPVPVRPRPKPQKKQACVPPQGRKPFHLLAPTATNEAWHMDLCSLRILWFIYTIIALLDGHSRKLLALRVCRGSVTTQQMIRVLHESVREYGRPRFLITDHGCQFRKVFEQAVHAMGARLVRGRVRQPNFNGKAERFFRTLRGWQRGMLLPMSTRLIEKHCGGFRGNHGSL